MNCSVKIHELLFFCIYWLFSGGGCIDLNLDVLNCSPVTMLSVHLCVLSSELNLHLNQISTLTNTRLNNKNNKSTLVSSFFRQNEKNTQNTHQQLWKAVIWMCLQVELLHPEIMTIRCQPTAHKHYQDYQPCEARGDCEVSLYSVSSFPVYRFSAKNQPHGASWYQGVSDSGRWSLVKSHYFIDLSLL